MSSRSWSWTVGVAMAALVVLIVVTVLVVDPAQTVTADLGSLYETFGVTGWLSVAFLLVIWGAGVAAAAALAMLLGHLAWRDWSTVSRAMAWSGRVSSATAALGLVAFLSAVVPGFPFGLMFFSIAENLGTAPASGSMSSLAVGIFFSGLSLLGVAGAAGLVFAVLAFRVTRRAPELRRRPA